MLCLCVISTQNTTLRSCDILLNAKLPFFTLNAWINAWSKHACILLVCSILKPTHEAPHWARHCTNQPTPALPDAVSLALSHLLSSISACGDEKYRSVASALTLLMLCRWSYSGRNTVLSILQSRFLEDILCHILFFWMCCVICSGRQQLIVFDTLYTCLWFLSFDGELNDSLNSETNQCTESKSFTISSRCIACAVQITDINKLSVKIFYRTKSATAAGPSEGSACPTLWYRARYQ